MKERIRVKKTLTEEEKDNKRKINTLMNQTSILFDLEQFEHIEEDEEKRLSRKILYIKHRFEDLYTNQKYNLTLDTLSAQFGLTENYIQKNILSETKHLITIEYCSLGFTDPFMFKNLNFLERRILKWKKCFINRDSFAEYLSKYLFLARKNSDGSFLEIPRSKKMIELLFFQRKEKLIRKADVKELALKNKQIDILNKAKNDLEAIRPTIGEERYLQEKKRLIGANIDDFNITVKDLEVEQYLKTYAHKRYHLYAPGKEGTPSVLFYFYNYRSKRVRIRTRTNRLIRLNRKYKRRKKK